MTMYNVDKNCNVVKVIITLTLPSIKPDTKKLQEDLKEAFKKYGMEVLLVQLTEVENNKLLTPKVVDKVFKHACKVVGI